MREGVREIESGDRFGRLTVMLPLLGGRTRWICICDCGGTKTTRAYCLISGFTRSCGCLVRDTTWNRGLKGFNPSPETQWKKGHTPSHKLPVSSETIRKDKGKGAPRVYRKVAEPNVWRLRAVIVWEALNGPVPKGRVIHHRDRDSLNDTPTNLECLTRAEHAREHARDLAQDESHIWTMCRSTATRPTRKEPYMTTKTNIEAVAMSDEQEFNAQMTELAEPFWLKDSMKQGEFFDVNGFARALLASKPAGPVQDETADGELIADLIEQNRTLRARLAAPASPSGEDAAIVRERIEVDAKALREVLVALNGPGHYIRELQVTRNPIICPDNPINKLTDEFNAWVEAQKEPK